MSRTRQLSPKAAALVAAFDKTGQALGIFKGRSCTTVDALNRAEIAHQKSFDNLRKYITRLEKLREAALHNREGTNHAARETA